MAGTQRFTVAHTDKHRDIQAHIQREREAHTLTNKTKQPNTADKHIRIDTLTDAMTRTGKCMQAL